VSKNDTDVAHYNFKVHQPILIIFGTRVTERVFYRMFFASLLTNVSATRMWANAQRDGRPAKHMWRPLFNAAKFG